MHLKIQSMISSLLSFTALTELNYPGFFKAGTEGKDSQIAVVPTQNNSFSCSVSFTVVEMKLQQKLKRPRKITIKKMRSLNYIPFKYA